ncbi:cytochrome P450 [Rhizodiscina lignyota]|uniref:Cytochrome P450 n=1 Tax=Rhizodiscina lignyota TaxID=1504668 RepID=A0A9P4IDX0_9PEZI|nr:cytochrome P450 [Rhizodiscina lignyota]
MSRLRKLSAAPLPRACMREGVVIRPLPLRGARPSRTKPRRMSATRRIMSYKALDTIYSKRNRVFILPNVVTGPEVILPMTQIRWLLDQPDEVLNQNEVNRHFLHADRTMLHKNVIRDTVHGHVIRRELTKELDVYCNDIVEEIDHALTVNWGTNPNAWKEVAVYDTMLDVISRISNRVLVGDPLCRNKEYLKRTSTFSRGVVITAGLMNLTPAILQPLLCPFIMAYDTYQYWKITKFIFPIVKKRILKFRPGLDYKKPDYSEHNDYIQWALHDAFSHDDPQERTPQMITKRLSVLSFAAIQSSVITITNALFDIASSPSCADIQQSLRDEVKTVTASQPSEEWTRANLAKMHRLDSALRESMRLWGFISRGVMKMVVKREGVTIPSGEHLPYGSKVGVTAYGPHHDESIYPQAFKYDAFRFSRAIEDPALFENMFGSQDDAPKAPTMVTSNDNFMAFSHGRHACPGRFFAANQLKLLLAAITTKYEIEPMAERPENPWLNNTVGPPIWEKMRVRRRAETVARPVASTYPHCGAKGLHAHGRDP